MGGGLSNDLRVLVWRLALELDVPPTLSARVRLLGSGRSDKTDSHDPRAAALVALRHRSLRSVRAEDHVTMLRRSSRAREENRTPDLRITSASVV